MKLSFMETGFWYGCALRVAGVPAGAVGTAIRMMQWADFRHGFGVSYFERRRATFHADATSIRLVDDTMIDGGGQSSLIAGPAILDRATVAAGSSGKATVGAVNVGDCGWLGQLAEQATKRGLAASLSFIAEGSDATDLAGLYTARRTIVGLPGDRSPWWIETDAEFHSLAANGKLSEPGVVLTCVDTERHPGFADEMRAASAAAGIAVSTPAEITANDREKMRHGFEVDEDEWRSLAALGFGVLAESTERSLRGAGA